MHASQKARFRLNDCKQCGSRGAVSWIDEKSGASRDTDWVPTKPRCTNSRCPLSDYREASSGDWDLAAAIRAVG
jgi:hypothetical protein